MTVMRVRICWPWECIRFYIQVLAIIEMFYVGCLMAFSFLFLFYFEFLQEISPYNMMEWKRAKQTSLKVGVMMVYNI
jgi:hypothetical protein